MRIPFTKMHGLGNDFVVLDARVQALPPINGEVAAALADRHTGIGCDQLVLIEPSDTADLKMRIFNRDGGEVEACGNATRAVGLLAGDAVTIETLGGTISARPDPAGIAVDMGVPRFDWDAIPLAYAMDTLSMPVGWDMLENPIAVNVGNPHAIFFVEDLDAVQILSRSAIRLRVWERGAGLTRACGTGACATAVGAMRRGLVEREVTVSLPGGDLLIAWGEDTADAKGRITMTGPATVSYTGSFDWGAYA